MERMRSADSVTLLVALSKVLVRNATFES